MREIITLRSKLFCDALRFSSQVGSSSKKCEKIYQFRDALRFSSQVGSNSHRSEELTPVKMSYSSYESTGSTSKGSPILIMHGLFGSKSNWNSLSKALHNVTKRKVITVDARNHGESPHTDDFSYAHLATDIDYLMSELNFHTACLLGHSMGGRAVMTFALTQPEKVEKLIVVDISPLQSSTNLFKMDSFFNSLKSVQLDPSLSLSAARREADTQLSQTISDPNIRQFLLTNLTRLDGGKFQWRVNIDALSRNFKNNISQFPKLENFKAYTKPTLFIGGSKSDYMRKTDHSRIREYFPKAEFIYLDTGHWVHAEKPNEFIKLVEQFVNKN